MKYFLIVGTQRTGSSAIAETIGFNPMVTCGWEWTLEVPRKHKFKIAEHALASNFKVLSKSDQDHMDKVHNANKSWLGFRWLFSSSCKWIIHPRFSPALWFDRLEDFILWASQRTEIHIIHVVRRNSLDWLKSVYLARKANLYSKKQYPDDLKVKIPKWEAIYRLRAKNWVDSRLDTLKNTNPFLRINYEDFLENQDEIAARGVKFLKCNPISMNVSERRLYKQSKGNISDYIVNYKELLETLSRYGLLNSEIYKEP